MKSQWRGWFDVKLRAWPVDDGMFVGRFEIWAPKGADPQQVHEDSGSTAEPFSSKQEAIDDARRRADVWCENNYRPGP